jgi:hypothetical protein
MNLVRRALERGQEGRAIQTDPLRLLMKLDIGMWRGNQFETTVGQPDDMCRGCEQLFVFTCDLAELTKFELHG